VSQDGDITVAVLSDRLDIDIAISLWLSGYTARRASEVDVVLDLTRDGGLVVLESRSVDCAAHMEELLELGYRQPFVLLEEGAEVTMSADGTAVRSPWTLDGLRAALELATTSGTSDAGGRPRSRNQGAAGRDHTGDERSRTAVPDGLFAGRGSWAAKSAPSQDGDPPPDQSPKRLRRLV
jgi:hypothetical protein